MEEIALAGCVDSTHQPIVLTLMALTTEDVSKLRVGKLTAQGITTLRALKKFLNVKCVMVPCVVCVALRCVALRCVALCCVASRRVAVWVVCSWRAGLQLATRTNPRVCTFCGSLCGTRCESVFHIGLRWLVVAGRFMIKPSSDNDGVMLSCVGSGITNVSKKVT